MKVYVLSVQTLDILLNTVPVRLKIERFFLENLSSKKKNYCAGRFPKELTTQPDGQSDTVHKIPPPHTRGF